MIVSPIMSCCVCQKSKAALICGICKEQVCKSCTEFLENESLSFLTTIDDNLKLGTYCSICFAEKINPIVEKYNATMELAKNINVFEKSQGKETRLIKRKEAELTVTDCADKNETILRLAFQAAEKGFNAIIDVDLKPRKIKNGRHQHTLWSATALPANVTDRNIIKDRSTWSNPN